MQRRPQESSAFKVCRAVVAAALLVAVGTLPLPPSAGVAQADENRAQLLARRQAGLQRIRGTRPARLDGPLREINISDIEVREVVAETREIFPGSIVNISGVTTGCPCEDGPRCTDQVWVVAHREGRSNGLMLSRIEARWTIGPVQRWWLRRERLSREYRAVLRDRREDVADRIQRYLEAEQRLLDEFPRCASTLEQAVIGDALR